MWDFIDITLDYVSIPIKTIFWEVNIHKSQLPMHLLLKLWGQGRHLNKMQTINWGNADFFSLFSGVLFVLHMGSNDLYDRGKIHLYLNFFDMWGCFGWNCGDVITVQDVFFGLFLCCSWDTPVIEFKFIFCDWVQTHLDVGLFHLYMFHPQ